MGSEVKDYKLDEKVWEPITLGASTSKLRRYAIAEVSPPLLVELKGAHLMVCVYGRYVLVKIGENFCIERTENTRYVRGNIVSFEIDPEEIEQVILRREIKNVFQEKSLIVDSAGQGTPVIVPEKNESEIAFAKMLNRWDAVQDVDKRAEGAVFPFKKDIVLYCLQHDLNCWWDVWASDGKIRLRVVPQKSTQTSSTWENGVRWALHDGYRETEATTSVLETLKKTPDVIYEYVYPIVIMYTGSKTDIKKLRVFYDDVQNNRTMFERALKEEKEEQSRKLKEDRPQGDFLSSTNFYDEVRKQMKENPSQTAFYFKKTGQLSDEWAFSKAMKGNDQWTQRWLPGVHACFLKENTSDIHLWHFIIALFFVMVMVTFGTFVWFSETHSTNSPYSEYATASLVSLCCMFFADVIGCLCYQLFIERRAKQLVVR
jgi:hypothetical protein